MSKVEFKEFVRKNPHLIDVVSKNETSWQKLYELYDLYGEENEVWNKYKKTNATSNQNNNQANLNNSFSTFKDLFNFVKGIDLNSVQKGLNSLDKAIEAFKELTPTAAKGAAEAYEPRPTYRYFED